MLERNETIALEGPVCAGKTTLITSLLPLGFTKISEYVDFALENSYKLPKFPPQNKTQAKSNFEFYLDIEKKRQQGIKPGSWLLDRSKYSLLAFEAGARNITQIDIFEWSCNLIRQHKLEVIEPNHVFYIDVPPKESKIRADLVNMNVPDFFFSKEFTQGFKEAFALFKNNNLSRFTFIDGSQPYCDVLSEISQRICSKAGINSEAPLIRR